MAMKGGSKNEARTRAPAPKGDETASAGNGQTSLSEEELRRMIAQAAYLRAAQRGFAPGGEIGDWLTAEREIRGALELGRMARRPDDASAGAARPHRGMPAETPPADATAR